MLELATKWYQFWGDSLCIFFLPEVIYLIVSNVINVIYVTIWPSNIRRMAGSWVIKLGPPPGFSSEDVN